MTDQPELKSCLLCKWPAEANKYSKNEVHCTNSRCGLNIHHLDCLVDTAIAAWNQRAVEPTGNSDELNDRMLKKIQDEIICINVNLQNAHIPSHREHDLITERKALEWVLSLKKPEEE